MESKPRDMSLQRNLYEYLEASDLSFVSHMLCLFQDHEENSCPAYPVSCPNKCVQTIPRAGVSKRSSPEGREK